MSEFGKYPENRLNIRIDENGRITFEKNEEFAKYYMPTREEAEEELEELQYELDSLNLDEPADILSAEHDEWEEAVSFLEEEIRELEKIIETLQ